MEGPPGALFWLAVQGQRHPGDDAHCALRPQEDVAEVGSGCRPGCPAEFDQGAVWQHHLERVHHVLDVAVGGRELAGSPGRDPAAHGAQGDRLRPVADGEAQCGDRLLGYQAVDPGVEGGDQVDVVDLAYPVHRRQVHKEHVLVGPNPTADAAAKTERHDGGAGLGCQADHGLHVGGRAGPHHSTGAVIEGFAPGLEVAEHPVVVAAVVDVGVGGQHPVGAEGVPEPDQQVVGEHAGLLGVWRVGGVGSVASTGDPCTFFHRQPGPGLLGFATSGEATVPRLPGFPSGRNRPCRHLEEEAAAGEGSFGLGQFGGVEGAHLLAGGGESLGGSGKGGSGEDRVADPDDVGCVGFHRIDLDAGPAREGGCIDPFGIDEESVVRDRRDGRLEVEAASEPDLGHFVAVVGDDRSQLIHGLDVAASGEADVDAPAGDQHVAAVQDARRLDVCEPPVGRERLFDGGAFAAP